MVRSLFARLGAADLSRVIAGQNRTAEVNDIQRRIVVQCVELLPGAKAETLADALALAVVANRALAGLTEPGADAAALEPQEQQDVLRYVSILLGKVTDVLETRTGIAAETFTGITPQMN